MIAIEYIRVQAKKDVDETSEEAEYRNIPGEVRTPEYENEARIEDGEDDGLGSKTDVSIGSAAWKNTKEQTLHCPGCIDQWENPAPPSIHNWRANHSTPTPPNNLSRVLRRTSHHSIPLMWNAAASEVSNRSCQQRSRAVWAEVRTDDVPRGSWIQWIIVVQELTSTVNTMNYK